MKGEEIEFVNNCNLNLKTGQVLADKTSKANLLWEQSDSY